MLSITNNLRLNKQQFEALKMLSRASKNLYSLNDEAFASFGQNVPENISAVINMSDNNYQNQFDNPYLLFSSAGEVAEVLNKSIGFEKISLYLSKVNKWIRENNNSLAMNEEELDKITKQINEKIPLDSLKIDLIAMQKLEAGNEELENNKTNLQY